MAHNITLLKGPGTDCVTLITKCFVSAVAPDHALSVCRIFVDSDEYN